MYKAHICFQNALEQDSARNSDCFVTTSCCLQLNSVSKEIIFDTLNHNCVYNCEQISILFTVVIAGEFIGKIARAKMYATL